MKKLEGLGQRPGCGRLLLKGVLLSFVLFLFRYELGFLFDGLVSIYQMARRRPVTSLPPVDILLPHLLFLGTVLLGILGMIALVAFLAGRSLLPAHSPSEHLDATLHFLSGLSHDEGAVTRVREGALISQPGEYYDETVKKIRGGSVLIVDANSTVVLEGSATSTHLRRRKPSSPRYPLSRVGKPGLVFVRRGEHFRGVVSLRRQFRINLNVLSHTGDGIEMKCHVFSIFSLSQPPAILKVAYCGAIEPASLRVLAINPETRRIQSITDDLDDADKAEIHRFAQSFIDVWNPLAPLEMDPASSDQPPYPIDDQRIFGAVYSRARHVKEGNIDTWSDLPTQVATEIFRNMISVASYDSLYGLEDGSGYALQTEFKPAFGRRMRTLGVVNYQFVYRQDGSCPARDQRVDNRSFYISPVQELRGSKVLRDAGIKVIAAGFAEPSPVDAKIKQQRLDNWRARWQREADIARAGLEFKIEVIRGQVKAEKQREMITSLIDIIKNTSYSEEALTLYVFQALEDLAADPTMRVLMPADTIRLLNGLRTVVLQDERANLDNRLPAPDDLDGG